MSAVKEVIDYGIDAGGGQTIILHRTPGFGPSRIHSIDMGDLAVLEPTTHVTRDGHPMTAIYSPDHGWMVAVYTL